MVVEVPWGDLHEAVRAWWGMKQGLPPLYATMREMPVDTCQGLLYLLKLDSDLERARARERAAVREAEERGTAAQMQAAESMRRLGV